MFDLSFAMKFLKLSTIFLVTISVTSCATSQTSETKSNEIRPSQIDLQRPDQNETTKSSGNCEVFVNAFPKDFETFKSLYGYDEIHNSPRPLYKKYDEDISYFFSCVEQMDPKKAVSLLVDLCNGGTWDADAAELLQTKTLDYIESHSNDFLQLLTGVSEKKSASLWYFLLDGPHPNSPASRANYEKLRTVLKSDDKQLRILDSQFARVRRQSHNEN